MNAPKTLILASLLAALSGCSTVRQVGDPASLPLDGKAVQVREKKAMAYSVATNIKADPQVVWGILTNASGYTAWNSTIVKLEGRIEQGEKIELVSKVAPDRTFKLKVSELAPAKRMVWEDGMPMGMFLGVRTFTLTPAADGSTNFTMSEAFSGGMLGMIEKSLPDMRASFETFAADLKRKAESQAG